MDSIFTIPYGEYSVADRISKLMSKYGKISVLIPSSRQEKGFDLVLYGFDEISKKNHYLNIQVKQSKTYYSNKVVTVDDIKRQSIGKLWFNRFCVQDNVDWYILTGIYITYPKAWEEYKLEDMAWESINLAFRRDEMDVFMKSVKQRRDKTKDDKYFEFVFDNARNIYLVRGCLENRIMTQFLLENRIEDI